MKKSAKLHSLTMSVSLFLGSLMAPHLALACTASHDPRANFFISYEKPYAGLFADGAEVRDIHPTIVDNCKDSVGQFLMLGLAVRTQKSNGRTADINFDNKFKNDSCRIENNPFPVQQTFAEKDKAFQNQYKILRACTYYDITEIDDNEILLPEQQPTAAKIQMISKSHLRAEGDFIYLKINRNNRFAIGVGLKKECTRMGAIRAMGLQPADVSALLNTYVSGDASGVSTDLTSIGSTRVRLAITPGSDLMNVSSLNEPLETPSWPSIYKTQIEIGSLSIKNERDDRSRIDFTPMVENMGKLNCRNGICSSEASYQTPVSGLVELVDLSGPRRKVIESWYFGATAPAQYQGLVESASKYIDPGLIRIGKHYAVEMTMVDPYEDYLLFKNGLGQMVIDLTSSLDSVAGMDSVGSLGVLGAITGTKILSGFGSLGPDASNIISSALSELNTYKGVQSWPPYFEKSCVGQNGECFPRHQVKYLKKIGAEFTVGEIQNDQSYQLQNLQIYSADPVQGYQFRKNSALPSFDCGGSK